MTNRARTIQTKLIPRGELVASFKAVIATAFIDAVELTADDPEFSEELGEDVADAVRTRLMATFPEVLQMLNQRCQLGLNIADATAPARTRH